MTDRHDSILDTPATAGAPIDDEAIGGLVRDVASGWTMPPQRIDARTWRDRVHERETAPAGRRWRRRLAAPAGLAVAATVLLAIGATWLNDSSRVPTTGSDASRAPTGSIGPTGPAGTPAQPSPSHPAISPLPRMAVFGDPLPVPALLIPGFGHRPLDLTTGSLGEPLERSPEHGGSFVPRPGGGWTCVCRMYDRPPFAFAEGPTSVSIDLIDYDATGARIQSRFLNTYADAVADPRLIGWASPVDASAWQGDRPDRVYLAWVVRTPDGWESGLDVVDLVDARVIQKVHLPDLALEDGSDAAGQPYATVASPPIVTVAPDGSRLVIGQQRGVLRRDASGAVEDFAPTASAHWGAPIVAGEIGALTAFAGGPGSLEGASCAWPSGESFASDEVYVVNCGSAAVQRRVDPRDGRLLGDVHIGGVDVTLAEAAQLPDGRRFVWFPFSRTLVEIDAIAGRELRRVTIDGLTGARRSDGDGGPLDTLADIGRRLGRWIAPPALAKVILDPTIAVAPDGSRLYLLGMSGTSVADGGVSTGVHVVETASLTEVATWPPTADWMSMAISRDGSLVYLIGAPGMAIDASGALVEDLAIGSSLTVLDAVTGEVRAVAGLLGSDYFVLDQALVP